MMLLSLLLAVRLPILVVFGRAGAGKTTIADQVQEMGDFPMLHLDLDACVPQWMRDNFAAGIYPNLEQRREFAISMCDHVDEKCLRNEKALAAKQESPQRPHAALVSFSFVNNDLRDIFRSRFPSAEWVLVDTNEKEAERRIRERKNHFYKGKVKLDDDSTSPADKSKTASLADNSDWIFAPVSFPHVVLDGEASVEQNSKRTLEVLTELVSKTEEGSL